MTSLDWHVDDRMLEQFARSSQLLDDIAAASIEAHLIACDRCRRVVASASDRSRRLQSWDSIADTIDRPKMMPTERVAERVGLPTAAARLVGVTPALQLATLASIVVLAALSVLASLAADSATPFVLVAPLVPLATVGLLSASTTDPAGEIGVPTPLHGFALLVRRSVVTLVVTVVALAAASIAVPNVGAIALAWVLPGLALATTAVLLAAWVRPEVAVASLAVAWVGVFACSALLERRELRVESWHVFSTGGLIAWGAAAVAAAVLLVARRDRFATMEVYR